MKRFALVLCLVGSAAAQDPNQYRTPEIKTYEGDRFYSGFLKKYLPSPIAQTNWSNSTRLEQLMRAGNIYLSLQDAIDLALENNLDIEYHRYDRRQAETDQLRASAGQLLRFTSSSIRAGFSSASSGVLGGANSLGAGGGGSVGSGQTSILSGFTIQAAGSSIPNLEPLAFLSWQQTHRTSILTSANVAGTTALFSNARTLVYGVQKSFLSGTQVSLDWAQQSLFQNAPANLYNPSLNGNVELSINQSLLQGFGYATNKRAITQARNNLQVADLNFKEQVMQTVKNVVDLYWDLVSFDENVKAKQRALQIAQKLYDDNRQRLGLGVIAPIDLVQSEASMQTAQLDLRSAQTQALQQEMIIKSTLTRSGVDTPLLIDAHIVPTDSIVLPESEAVVPVQDMITEALASRPELKETAISLENARNNMKGVKNAMRPGLNLFVDLQNSGQAGQVNDIPIPIDPGSGLPLLNRGTVNPTFLGGYSTILSQVFGRHFPNYSIGFNLNVPLKNSGARADMIKNQLDYRQAEINQKQQENTIKLNVLTANIALQQARATYNTAVQARQLQQQTADGEQHKYELGTSTVQNVVIAQRDLVTAEASEISALNSYVKARTNLDVVIGKILEVHHVDLEEAFSGSVKHPPSPMPVLDTPRIKSQSTPPGQLRQ